MRQATPTAPLCRTCGSRHYPATNGAGLPLECGTSRPHPVRPPDGPDGRESCERCGTEPVDEGASVCVTCVGDDGAETHREALDTAEGLPDPQFGTPSPTLRAFARGLRESLCTVASIGYPYGCGVVDGASGSVEYPSPFHGDRLGAYRAGFIQGTALRRAWGSQ